jgi:alpha-L-rhamnosidase
MKKRLVFLSLWLLIAATRMTCSAQVAVTKLTTEYLSNPVGIDVETPRLSWIIESKERGYLQSAYQVLIATSPEKLTEQSADIWNSGKVTSDRSVLIPFKDHQLNSRQRYYWKVRVWNSNDKVSDFSDVAYWEMALLKRDDWQGKWLSAPKVYDWAAFVAQRKSHIKQDTPEVDDAAPQFRKSFAIAKKVKQARLYISGIGYNVPCMNGQKIGERLLDPAFTRYDKTVLYSVYDITDKLKTGDNVVGVTLGNGWYNMVTKDVWGYDHAQWRSAPCLLAQIEILFEDGSKNIVATDESWKTAPGPIVFNSIRQGEFYDATKETKGWENTGFNDANWLTPLIVSGPAGKLKAQMIQPVSATERFVPQKITQPAPGIYVFDLGKNIAGFAELKLNAPAGTAITLKYAERLDANGRVDQADIAQHVAGKMVQTDKYICKGQGTEIWHPSFMYHGFQYVEVSGLPQAPDEHMLTGIKVHTAMESAGSFECSNEMFNSIQQATLNSYQSNFMGYPTDCPQREKNGWTGDAHLAAETGLYNFRSQNAYTKWLNDIADEQKATGELAAIVPTAGWGYFWGNGPAWDNAMVLIPWYMYEYSGDEMILQQMYPHIKRYVDYLGTKAENNIVSIGLGDWAPAKTKTPADITSTAYYYVDAVLLERMANIFGYTDDAKKYTALAGQINDAFNKRYYHNKGLYGEGSQTALSCAIYQGLCGNNLKATIAALADSIKKNDNHLDCGMLGTKYLLNALSENGRSDVAYKIVDQRTFPSWGNWIAQGATTLWEQWNGTESHNHIMFGDVSAWFYKNLAGINTDKDAAGFKRILFRPYFAPELTWAKGSHQSMYGEVKAGWTRSENIITYNLSIPANTTGEVVLPNNKKILLNNVELSKSAPNVVIDKQNGTIKVKLGSGDHEIKLM